MNARRISLWNFGDGYTKATIDLGSPREFFAWSSLTYIDSLSTFDRDNACCIEVYRVDGAKVNPVAHGGDHFGPEGDSYKNLRPGAFRGFGQTIQFRLRTFHVDDLSTYGVGCVLILD
jgi:hypothetical protein